VCPDVVLEHAVHDLGAGGHEDRGAALASAGIRVVHEPAREREALDAEARAVLIEDAERAVVLLAVDDARQGAVLGPQRQVATGEQEVLVPGPRIDAVRDEDRVAVEGGVDRGLNRGELTRDLQRVRGSGRRDPADDDDKRRKRSRAEHG